MVEVAERGGNPSSIHQLGQRARAQVEGAEAALLQLLNLERGAFYYGQDGAEADALAIEAALRERVGPVGGRVLLVGPPVRWAETASDLSWLRGGSLVAVDDQWGAGADGLLVRALSCIEGALGARADGRVPLSVWQADCALPSRATGAGQAVAFDVVVLDAFSPIDGAWQLCPVSDGWVPQPGVRPPHLHLALGGLGLPYAGESWQHRAAPVADTVSLTSQSLGAPAGLAAVIVLQGEPPDLGLGTVPTELVVGMGAAAKLLDESARADLARRRDRLLRAFGQAEPADGDGLPRSLGIVAARAAAARAGPSAGQLAACNLQVLPGPAGSPLGRCWLYAADDDRLITEQLTAARELGLAAEEKR